MNAWSAPCRFSTGAREHFSTQLMSDELIWCRCDHAEYPPEYVEVWTTDYVNVRRGTWVHGGPGSPLEAHYAKAQAHVDRFTQSLLAKAFLGELVLQYPNDEPTSVLLERPNRPRARQQRSE